MASHPSFHIFRRFSHVRVRLLLYKQDRLSVLEKKLEAIDCDESRPMFLGTTRLDRNVERAQVMAEIESALATYGP
jgi:hypothetical protein